MVCFFQNKLNLIDQFVSARLIELIGIFREIQLLSTMYNEFHKTYVIPGTIIVAISGCSTSLYIFIAGRSELLLMPILMYANGAAICSFYIVGGFHLAVRLFAAGKEIVESIGCGKRTFHRILCIGRQEGRILRKYWKSFPVVKIYFFEGNFDRRTPLTLLEFSISITINLILCEP